MANYAVDVAKSRVTIRTRAKGFLSALAHDLELTAPIARGSATRDGDSWQGELVVDPATIKIVGSIKGGSVSPLSKIEVDIAEKRIVNEVFAGVREIVVKVRGTVDKPTIEVTAKKTAPAKMRLSMTGDVIEGRGTISIQGLGSPEVKAPLNAFTVRDDVDLEATIALSPA